ncbi:TetR/AcrR family transcriptional regulator [Solimonas sp. K1W22B-7]|uniref:TetR/AcrR family transcriptional regulator n=1 Tax=Solimonas sp. K1W22B-7 TaxID=2303331 RepID=UPI0013C3FDA1|nr:TetR/AcrR family transcriptional regulator [Solimonas sp. K1W22B-7]
MTPEEVEAMRRRLSSAGLRIYRQEGLEALTFRRLADALDVSHMLPYRYFDNKDALLARMRVDALGQFESYVREHESRADGPMAQVHAVAEAYVAFAQQHPAEYLLIFATHQPAPGQYPEVLQARRSVFEHAVEVLQRCIDQGRLQGEASELAHALWVNLHGLMTLHAAGQLVHGKTLEQLVEPLLGRLLNGYRT